MSEAAFFLSACRDSPSPGKFKGHTSPVSTYCALGAGNESSRSLTL